MTDKKLLIVDDEVNILNLFHSKFTKDGYDVLLAENAEQALELLAKENVSVMFLDINMPGMNGLDLCRAIRKNQPIAIIYAMTGYSSLFELTDCLEAGFDDYFLKPINLKLLSSAVEQAFERLKRWKTPH